MIEIKEEVIQNPLLIKLTTNREIIGLKLALQYVLDHQTLGSVDYSVAGEILNKLAKFEELKK